MAFLICCVLLHSEVAACEHWMVLLHQASVLLHIARKWFMALSFASIFCKKWLFSTKTFHCNCCHFSFAFVYFRIIEAGMWLGKNVWEWSYSPFTACVHNCFYPPDGTPLLLNENAGTLQSDEQHPSKTSSVPHPKFCWSNTVQEKKTFKVCCISSL